LIIHQGKVKPYREGRKDSEGTDKALSRRTQRPQRNDYNGSQRTQRIRLEKRRTRRQRQGWITGKYYL